MKVNRILAFVSGGVALILSCLIYLEYIHMLGFPDGFITELGYAERKLAWIFIVVSLILCSCFVYLARSALREKIGKKLSVAAFVYLAFIIGITLLDYHYRSTLMDGGGG
jgi:hypothetical protein